MLLNTIYTDEGYLAHGFTTKELPLIREHDKLFNKSVLEGLTDIEKERMFFLAEKLKL